MTGSQAAQQGTAGDQAPIKAPKEVIRHSSVGLEATSAVEAATMSGGEKSRR